MLLSNAFSFPLSCKAIIDISYQNTLAFENAGIKSFHFDPIIKQSELTITSEERNHNLFRSTNKNLFLDYRKAMHDRYYDVCFFGNYSAKRDKFFSRNSKFFSEYDTFMYYRKTDGIIPSSAFTTVPKYVSQNSKLNLNIHRDESNFFEWHRIVLQGMACGSVVITDECLEHPLYKNGKHFLTESVRHIPDMIQWLLNTEDGYKKLEDIQRNCFYILSDETIIKSKKNDI